jgi:hypothetical protein
MYPDVCLMRFAVFVFPCGSSCVDKRNLYTKWLTSVYSGVLREFIRYTDCSGDSFANSATYLFIFFTHTYNYPYRFPQCNSVGHYGYGYHVARDYIISSLAT